MTDLEKTIDLVQKAIADGDLLQSMSLSLLAFAQLGKELEARITKLERALEPEKITPKERFKKLLVKFKDDPESELEKRLFDLEEQIAVLEKKEN